MRMGYHVPENRLQVTLLLLAIGGLADYSQLRLQGEEQMQRQFRTGLAVMAVLVTGGFGLSGNPAHGAGQGDYYILALSWVPSWCVAEGDKRNAAQCKTDAGWQVHGLWPQYAGGGWPEYCETDQRDPSRARTSAMSDIMGYGGLAWHQWKKHGRCSGLTADTYFRATRYAFDRLTWPARLTEVDRVIHDAPEDIEAAFRAANPDYGPDMVIATCRDGNLQELRLCLGPDLTPRRCDEDVLDRACHAPYIALPAQR